MKDLLLIRGLPGSGKSSIARSIGGVHFEADMYFIKDGIYNFDFNKIKDAHAWCLESTEKAMLDNESKIIVSNTFTQEWEMKNYYKLASVYGYRVFSIIAENRHSGINEHNVPSDTLAKMKARFEVIL